MAAQATGDIGRGQEKEEREKGGANPIQSKGKSQKSAGDNRTDSRGRSVGVENELMAGVEG